MPNRPAEITEEQIARWRAHQTKSSAAVAIATMHAKAKGIDREWIDEIFLAIGWIVDAAKPIGLSKEETEALSLMPLMLTNKYTLWPVAKELVEILRIIGASRNN